MFGYPCPNCEQRLLASPERAGQRTICPKCLKPIVIPSPAIAVSEPVPPVESVPELDDEQVPLGHEVDGDLESALRADAAAQDTPAPSQSHWRSIHSAPTVTNEVEMPREPVSPPLPKLEEVVPDPEPELEPEPIEQSSTVTPHRIPAPTPRSIRMPTPLPRPSPLDAALPGFPSSPIPGFNAMNSQDELDEPPAPPEPAPEPPTPAPVLHAPKMKIETPASTYTPPPPLPQTNPSIPAPPRFARAKSRDHDSRAGMVIFNPTSMESQDIAAELTAALTLRMKPPSEPPSDLHLSTGVWLGLTATAISLWLYSLIYQPSPLKYVAFIGILELLIAYSWVVYSSYLRDPKSGLMAIFPPLAIAKIFNPSPMIGYRPMRFLITSILLISIYYLGLPMRPYAQNLLGLSEQAPTKLPLVVETPTSKIAEAEGQRSIQPLCDVLQELANPSALLTADQAQKEKLVAKLQELTRDSRTDIRKDAMSALAIWDPDSAKAPVLQALKSDRDSERLRAIILAGQWKDLQLAREVANLIGDREMSIEASTTLKRIGWPVAEEVIVELIPDADLVETPILDIAESVGGPKTAAALRARAAKLKSREDKRRLESIAMKLVDRHQDPKMK